MPRPTNKISGWGPLYIQADYGLTILKGTAPGQIKVVAAYPSRFETKALHRPIGRIGRKDWIWSRSFIRPGPGIHQEKQLVCLTLTQRASIGEGTISKKASAPRGHRERTNIWIHTSIRIHTSCARKKNMGICICSRSISRGNAICICICVAWDRAGQTHTLGFVPAQAIGEETAFWEGSP